MRAMVPSDFMISHMTPAGTVAPAIRARSTLPSVCPMRTSTPPSRAIIGNICPGRAKSDATASGATAARIVAALSAALIPVVTPCAASMLTVNPV